jgi:periplasmic protein CpxP/Spy
MIKAVIMKRVLAIMILICSISITTFSQEKEIAPLHQKDSAVPVNVIPVKKIKQANLTSDQKKQVKKYKKTNKAKKVVIKNNTALTEQQKKEQLGQLKTEKQQKLEAILTPEQKEKMKQTKENKPRRGVTNMPNERTAK